MQLLVKRLGHCQVHPYYVYVHDLVKGVEDLRTTLQTALDIEKAVRGVDRGLPHADVRRRRARGGGKRVAHCFEHYDRETGISVFTAPSVQSPASSSTSIRSTRSRDRRCADGRTRSSRRR